MLIKSLYVENFRCYTNQNIDFEMMTAIVGRNGSGKTTLLSALDIFYDTKASVSEEDFYGNDTSLTIRIRVVFTGFRLGEEQETFAPYIQNNEMPVTKVISNINGNIQQKYFASTKQIPQFASIRNISGKTNQVTAINDLAEKQELPGLNKIALRGADAETFLAAYEKEHPECMKWLEREEQFFGAKNVGGGRLDKFTKFVRVPAVRDVMDDIAERRGSPITQLLDIVVMRKIEVRTDIRNFRSEFEQRARQLYCTENLQEIKDLEAELNVSLKRIAPNAGFGLIWGEPKVPEVPYPSVISSLVEDGFAGAINRKGHGVQRALIFSMLQNLAIAAHSHEDIDNSINQGEESESQKPLINDISAPDLIFAIDEPELYQHPLRSKHIMSVLREMAQSVTGMGGRNQVIYTTHSQYFVDIKNFSEIRIIRKCYQNDSNQAPCSSVSKYSLEEASREMARIDGAKDQTSYTGTSFYAHTYPVMTLIVNEGFFADAVVLVEGLTEVAFLFAISQILNACWLEKGIGVIPVEGKSKLDRAGIIFRGLKIPSYIVFDGDKRNGKTPNCEKEKESNRRLLMLVNANPEDFPSDGVYPSYACFEEEIESYCKAILGEKFYYNLLRDLAVEFGFSKPSTVLKNFECAYSFVMKVYEQGKTLPMLEEIVKCVNKLVASYPQINATSISQD